MKAYIDLSEFMASPLRTGIQRVGGELCRFWPQGHELIPVVLTRRGGYTVLPRPALRLIRSYFDAQETTYQRDVAATVRAMSEEAGESGDLLRIDPHVKILVPEMFCEPARLAFFRSLTLQQLRDNFHFILFDLLPLTHPQFFPSVFPPETVFGYYRQVGMAKWAGFISSATRDAFYGRFLRATEQNGRVFRLGSDGLGPRRRSMAGRDGRAAFTVIGTIEPRKNHEMILDAFEPLMAKRPDVHLTFAGALSIVAPRVAERIVSLAVRSRQFSLVTNAGDSALADLAANSVATIYVSEAEGFGLPPVESLWLGTPVIASAGIPSLEKIGTAGVHIVDPLTPLNIRKAAVAFLDESYRMKKAYEVEGLDLPTWPSFASEVCEWVEAGA